MNIDKAIKAAQEAKIYIKHPGHEII